MKKVLLYLLSAFLLCNVCKATVRLPRLIGNNMVLQRDAPLRIWGWAAPGEAVQVDFIQQQFHTTTGSNGKWAITIPPQKAGGPYDMRISGSNILQLDNILIGDVWLCSGQSNMELSMERLKDKYPQLIATASNPQIRQFNVSTTITWDGPQEDYKTGSWQLLSPQTIPGFTAVGYFFASELYQRYHIPIGIIKCAAGGSTAEAWMDEQALQPFPTLLQMAHTFQQPHYVDSLKAREAQVNDAWYTHIWQCDKGLLEKTKWFDSSYNYASWPVCQVPGLWKNQGVTDSQGVVWLQKEITVSKAFAAGPARLWLGNAIDRDSVYVNGRFAGTTGYQYPPRKYALPAGMLHEGKNSIVMRVINYSGDGGFYKGKRYQLFNDKDTIELSGAWHYQVGCSTAAIPATIPYYLPPLGLNNGMIAPLKQLSLKGVIWYQGEANTDNAAAYTKLFPALITSWRGYWQQQTPDSIMPFLFVQLANYMETRPTPVASNWAALRAAQAAALSLPATGMAVTIDIGEWNDIHPLDKQDVGRRLALCAMHIAYKDSATIYQGPTLQKVQAEGNKLVLTFSHTDKGLLFNGALPQQFAIAGDDLQYKWADAKQAGNKIIIWNKDLAHPVALRYAWADNPAAATLRNGAGLPASPFEYHLQ